LESYLKTMSYAHCRQSFFEKFRRQAPIKSVIVKMIKKFHETGSLLDKIHNRQKSVLTPGILQDIQKAITRSAEIKCTNGYLVRFSPYCGEEDAEILSIPNAGFSRANCWRLRQKS